MSIVLIIIAVIILGIITGIFESIFELIREKAKKQKNSNLLKAVTGGDVQNARTLIGNGADINYIGFINHKKKTALQIAVENHDKDILLVFLLYNKVIRVYIYIVGNYEEGFNYLRGSSGRYHVSGGTAARLLAPE